MVKKKLLKLVEATVPFALGKGLLPHQAPSACKCVHSQAWQLKKARPPMIVQKIHFTTPFLSPLCPACTAKTMVTELMISINVIRLTKASGRLACPAKGNALNTWLGSGHELLEKRTVPYEIRKAPNVKASLMRKYHI